MGPVYGGLCHTRGQTLPFVVRTLHGRGLVLGFSFNTIVGGYHTTSFTRGLIQRRTRGLGVRQHLTICGQLGNRFGTPIKQDRDPQLRVGVFLTIFKSVRKGVHRLVQDTIVGRRVLTYNTYITRTMASVRTRTTTILRGRLTKTPVPNIVVDPGSSTPVGNNGDTIFKVRFMFFAIGQGPTLNARTVCFLVVVGVLVLVGEHNSGRTFKQGVQGRGVRFGQLFHITVVYMYTRGVPYFAIIFGNRFHHTRLNVRVTSF